MARSKKTEIGGEVPTNGAENLIQEKMPYIVNITVEGTTDILFHAWNCESIAEKGNAKHSRANYRRKQE